MGLSLFAQLPRYAGYILYRNNRRCSHGGLREENDAERESARAKKHRISHERCR